jgi:putative FmdB family regulatory protein
MPTYEFRCKKCSHVTEEIRMFSERFDDPPDCPKCLGDTERLTSGGTGFVLKGGGTGWADKGYSGAPPPKKGKAP